MIKAKSSLDSMLSCKEQVPESFQGKHTAIMAEVQEQENMVERSVQRETGKLEGPHKKAEAKTGISSITMRKCGNLRGEKLPVVRYFSRKEDKLILNHYKQSFRRREVLSYDYFNSE